MDSIRETLKVQGRNVEVRTDSRRYPGTVYRWGYWRFEGETEWRFMGSQWSGRGALAEIRKEVSRLSTIESEVRAAIQEFRENYRIQHGFASYSDINNGNCELFRDVLKVELESCFPSEDFEGICVRDLEGYNQHWADAPEIFQEMAEIPYHAWLIHRHRHYDAEAPNGVQKFFQLPFFDYYANQTGGERTQVIEESKGRANDWVTA